MTHSSKFTGQRIGDLRRLLDRRDDRKTKTSVSVSGELLRAADLVAGPDKRSALIERALRHYLETLVKRARHRHDLAMLNAAADAINRDSDEVRALQAWLE